MKLFRKSHSVLLKNNLLPTPQDMTQDMLTPVLRVEQGAYSHPWLMGNFVDSIVSGYHMPVWWHGDELLCYLVAMRGAAGGLAGRQCAMSTGSVMLRSSVRVAPPSTHSRARLWP